MYPNQKEITDKEELFKAIEKAKNVKELDVLRMSVVRFRSNEVLNVWKKKFWAYKDAAQS